MTRFLHEPRRRLLAATVLALLVASLLGTSSSAAPLPQGTIFHPYITNVRQNQFVVSWTTQSSSTAAVTYGTTIDGTGWLTVTDSVDTTSHYVTVSGLTDSTPYFFDTVSGTTVDNNGGAHYTVTTGAPPVGTPLGYTQGGRVYYFGTTTGVPNAIVYLLVQHVGTGVVSQLASVRTNASGVLNYNLTNLRTADNNSYFYPGGGVAGDPITATAQGGVFGIGQLITVTAASGGSIGNITLNNVPNAITLRSLTSRADSSAWVPLGLALLGAATVLIVVRRRRG